MIVLSLTQYTSGFTSTVNSRCVVVLERYLSRDEKVDVILHCLLLCTYVSWIATPVYKDIIRLHS